jgi:hypothetical protein
MPKNTAQMALQSLLAMQGDAQDSAANLSKLEEARTEFMSRGGDEADFALPEAMATAVGVGWLLGPVGGLLMGVAQGILGKRERQNAIDAYADDMGVLSETNDIFNDELDRLAVTVTNPNDLEQISALQTQKDAAMRMMSSASPELQQKGSDLLADFSQRMNDYALAQENQRIEQEAYQAQMARELDSSQQSIVQGLHADYDSQSANYEQIVLQSNAARAAIEKGDPISLNAALIMVNKALDPTSVVRPEEAKALGNVGTVLEQTRSKLGEWIETGAPISEEQRQELYGLVDTIQTTARSFQATRDMRFQERAIDAGLPEKYVNDFELVSKLPIYAPQGFTQQEKAVDLEKSVIDPIVGTVTDTMEAVAPVDGSPSLRDRIADWYSGSGREKRQQKQRERRQTN